jgi:prepilin-type processing-associated H-X9-DG protein
MDPSKLSTPSNSQPPVRLDYAQQDDGKRPRKLVSIVFWGFLFALLIAAIIPSLRYPHPSSSRFKSASNLKQIGIAIQMYANDHNHHFPDSMRELLIGDYLTPSTFVEGSQGSTVAQGPTTRAMLADFAKPGHCSYLYFGAALSTADDPRTVVACEAPGSQRWQGINLLFADGHVEFVDAPAAMQLRAALAKGPVAWTSAGAITRPATQPATRQSTL